jgi:dTDP-4-dehydrorhamnose 3,5-epimerase
MSDSIKKTSIDGLLVIERPTFADERGFFHEVFRLNELKEMGIKFNPVQWGHSRSEPKVIRAIHSEDWQKIVYPVNGKVFIAIADVRPKSKTFMKVETFEMDNTKSDSPHQALYLAPGLGNSICVVGDEPVDYVYLVDEYWDNSKARGIAWDDPDLNIKWPVKEPIISERDRNNQTLRELYPDKFR